MTGPAEGEQPTPLTHDQVIALLGIYAGQVGSYTTMLWQVPALSLTAQSFLLTISLTAGNGKLARLIAAGLSVVISAASYALMHDQRGHAINHGELAMRLSRTLPLPGTIETGLRVDDGVPTVTNADELWTWHYDGESGAGRAGLLFRLGRAVTSRVGLMYVVWRACMFLFVMVDAGIITAVFRPVRDGLAVSVAVGVLLYTARPLVRWALRRQRRPPA
jgi:hypothetical protein